MVAAPILRKLSRSSTMTLAASHGSIIMSEGEWRASLCGAGETRRGWSWEEGGRASNLAPEVEEKALPCSPRRLLLSEGSSTKAGRWTPFGDGAEKGTATGAGAGAGGLAARSAMRGGLLTTAAEEEGASRGTAGEALRGEGTGTGDGLGLLALSSVLSSSVRMAVASCPSAEAVTVVLASGGGASSSAASLSAMGVSDGKSSMAIRGQKAGHRIREHTKSAHVR